MKPIPSSAVHCLVLPRALLDRIRRLAAEAYPDEGCGLLAGALERGHPPAHANGSSVWIIERVFEVRNTVEERSRDRYLMDPGDQLEAEVAAQTAGLEMAIAERRAQAPADVAESVTHPASRSEAGSSK